MTNSLIKQEDVLDSEDHNPTALNSEIWSVLMTILFGFGILCLWAFFQMLGMAVGAITGSHLEELKSVVFSGNEQALLEVLSKGDMLWMSAFFSSLGGVLVVWIAIRMKRNGQPFKEYLNLNVPDVKCWLKWIGIFVLFIIGLELLTQNFEGLETDFMTKVLLNTGNLPMLALTVGVLGPIFEEVFFRGFVFKGLVGELGGHLTVFLTSSIFALMHLGQYSWEIVIAIIPMGMVLGYARLYTGSLLVPILLHVANNLMATYLGLAELEEMVPAILL